MRSGVHREPVDPVAEPGVLRLRNDGAVTPVAPYELAEKIRASVNVLGPLLGRFGYAKLSLPGGDDFGSRPIDMHLRGLEAMGATFELTHGYVEARADVLFGADITLAVPERRRDGEHPHGRSGREGRDGDRQRRPRTRDRRPVPRCSSRWAPRSRASARRRSGSRGWTRRRCVPSRTGSCPTGCRRRRTSPPSASAEARSSSRTPTPNTWRCSSTDSSRWA